MEIIIKITNIYGIGLSILYVRSGKNTFRIISMKIRVKWRGIKSIINIQMMWRCIKPIINIQTKTNSQISSILVKEKIITEPKEITNAFNNYFSTIAFVLQDKVLHRNDKFNNYLSNPIQTSFFISPSSEQGILVIINGLNQNKTNGSHSIPSDILQMIKSNVFPKINLLTMT